MLTNDHVGIDSSNARECWEGVQRIAASNVFHRATRIRELLVYLADRSLHGSPEELTEPHIAEKVFGRKNYNPTEDNLVRASVRQLRLKLKEYFQTEGKTEPWIVELPKGSYHISFSRCRTERLDFFPVPAPEPPTQPASYRISATLFAVVAVVAVCSTALAVMFAIRNPVLRPFLNHKPTLMDLLVASPARQTQVVVIDSAFVLLQSFAGKNVGLEEYAGRTYFSELNPVAGLLPANTRKLLDSRQITSFSDVEIASAVSRDYGGAYPIRIRHARSMNVRDFKSDNNFLLIGSPLADPWITLFDRTLNFQFENHANSWPVIRNRQPRAGERAVYGSTASYDEAGPQYARIAVLHNHSGSGRVGLIAGTSMEGTEAAGEAFLDPSFAASMTKLLGVERVKNTPDFEMVIQTEGVGGAGYGTHVLAVRKLADQ